MSDLRKGIQDNRLVGHAHGHPHGRALPLLLLHGNVRSQLQSAEAYATQAHGRVRGAQKEAGGGETGPQSVPEKGREHGGSFGCVVVVIFDQLLYLFIFKYAK